MEWHKGMEEKELHTRVISNRLFNEQNLYKLGWLGFVAIFLIIGTVGHDPWWKRGETYSFGIVYHFYTTGTWLIPMNAGLPFMEKPPLYYWTATLFCHLFSGVLPLHDAARLASVLYMAIAAIFTWKASDALFVQREERKDMRIISVALLLGTYGLVPISNAMVTDNALLAGVAIAIYGMALLCKQPEYWKRAGIWLGIGIGMAFMTKGLVMPAVLGISGLIIWWLLPELHRHTTIKALAFAVASAAPFLLIWPTLLYHHSPSLFMEWFWDNNVGRFLGFSVARFGAENDRLHFLFTLPIFAFPIFLLACSEAWCGRRQWRTSEYLLPFAISIIGITVLFLSASCRIPYLLPLLPCFALLATSALMRVPPRLLANWNIAVRVAFSLFTVGIWLVWWNLLYPQDHRPVLWLARCFDHTLPTDFIPQGHQAIACFFAVVVALFWLASFRLRENSALNTARVWFAGSALAWCTIYTLLLPWINETRSFRTVVEQMQDFIKHSPYAGQCIANYQLGENMGPMLEYFMGLKAPLPFINLDGDICPLFLTFTLRDAPVDIDPRWHMVWHGTRLLDIRLSELRLYAEIK